MPVSILLSSFCSFFSFSSTTFIYVLLSTSSSSSDAGTPWDQPNRQWNANVDKETCLQFTKTPQTRRRYLVSVGPTSTSLGICVRIRWSREIVSLDRRLGTRWRFHGVRIMRQFYWLVIIYLTGRWLRSGLAESIDQSTHSRSAATSSAASYRTRCWNKTIVEFTVANIRFTVLSVSLLLCRKRLFRRIERRPLPFHTFNFERKPQHLQLGLWKCGLVGGLSYGWIGRLRYPWLGVSVKYEYV